MQGKRLKGAMDGMEGDLELISEDSNSRASCLSTASTECGSPSQVTSCTPQSLVEDSPSEQGSPSSSSRAAASAHAPFSLETAPASQRSTAVYPLPAVKPAGWEETAAYDEQNELHVAVLQLVFCMFSSRASVKTGPPTPPPNQTCYKTNWCALQGQAAAFLWSHSLASGARQSRNPRSQLRSRRAESRVHRGTASCHGPESRVYTGIASCHGAESRGTASCHEAWGLRLSKVTKTMSKKKAHDWLSISRGAR